MRAPQLNTDLDSEVPSNSIEASQAAASKLQFSGVSEKEALFRLNKK
jgi:hypothetical protein